MVNGTGFLIFHKMNILITGYAGFIGFHLTKKLLGFFNILELTRVNKINNLIYASKSSVYGNNNGFRLRENDLNNKPLQFYSATKIANEAMSFAYSNLYKFNSVGLRFFTVYGPWGRPDMAIYKFTHDIINKKKIKLNKVNSNYVCRDFTYIDDVIISIILIFKYMNKKKIVDIFNIGNGKPESIKSVVQLIEKNLNQKAKTNNKKLGKTKMNVTNCDISKFKKNLNINQIQKLSPALKNLFTGLKNIKI